MASVDINVGRVLVLGATGYVGSRLVALLTASGYRVRAAGRSIEKLKTRDWALDPLVELVQVDTRNRVSCVNALVGCTHVFYLVHSMNSQNKSFAEADRQSAKNVVEAAEQAGIQQLIYLGGLGENNLSEHLSSRAEVATILSQGGYATTVLRAAMIIGSGSASFEILRYLVDRLPIMITPRWVTTPSQPIAIRNVLIYLMGVLGNKEALNQTFDIGGPEVLTYRRLMEIYAEQAGLPKRLVIPVPVFTPRLSSYWINFISPVPAYIARPLAEGLRNPAICTESKITELVPQNLLSCEQAIRLALDKTQHHTVDSHWTDAGVMHPVEWANSNDPDWAGGTVFVDQRTVTIKGTAADAWTALSRIGGTTGWYYANWLWHLRGLVDWLTGGIGLRRGRRHPEEIRLGDAIDFWRVGAVTPRQRLLLVAQMNLPGQAVLEFEIHPGANAGETHIIQSARYLPSGLLGLAYWYLVSPLHEFVFNGMLKGIAQASMCKFSDPTKVGAGSSHRVAKRLREPPVARSRFLGRFIFRGG